MWSRVVSSIVLVAGCGRHGFDPTGDATAGGEASMTDAPTDSPMIGDDEPPCGPVWCSETTPVTDDLSGIWGTTSTAMWAAGGGGTILHRDANGMWSVVNSSGTGANLRTMTGAAADDVWAFGDNGGATHWDGTRWTGSRISTAELTGAWAASRTDIWVVGRAPDVFLRWNGTAWTSTDSTVGQMSAVWGASSTDAWAAGTGGSIARWNGTAWIAVTSPDDHDLHDIHGSGPDDVWIVGNAGTALHWTGTWTVTPTNTVQSLTSVWAFSPTDAWAVGSSGTLLHWDGSTWTPANLGSNEYITGMWATGRHSIRVVGALGTVRRGP